MGYDLHFYLSILDVLSSTFIVLAITKAISGASKLPESKSFPFSSGSLSEMF